MILLRSWLLAALVGLPLGACAMSDPGASVRPALPTAEIITPPPDLIRVIPLTFTPAPTTIARSFEPPGSTAQSFSTTMPRLEATAISNSTPAALGPPTPGDPAASLEAELIVEINKRRLSNGLPPYQVSPELSAAAREHSCDLAAHHIISHVSSDGRSLAERLAGGEQPWEWPSENIAAGTADPTVVVVWWMDEPPDGWHRRNILDAEQREVGAGYCYAEDDPSGNHSYWTADFSRRSTQP
jgi:uncharacterized protein YkwD